jgi:hypothetical protein
MNPEQLIPFSDKRLTTEAIDTLLYPIFYDMVSHSPFMNSNKRKEITDKWNEVAPNVTLINLRLTLSKMEKAYFENMEVIDRNGLRNRILEQQNNINEQVMLSNLPIDKKARAIVESNKLQATVAGLSDLAPSVEIVINTNAPTDLTARMNRSILEQDVQETPAKEAL